LFDKDLLAVGAKSVAGKLIGFKVVKRDGLREGGV